MTIDVKNDEMLGRTDSIYATRFYVMQKQIDELQQENEKYKKVIDKLNKYLHTRAIKKCYNGKLYCGFDGLQAQVFEDILKEVSE